MTVFTNRVRTAYVRKRSKRSMAIVTLSIMAMAGMFSFAAIQDEKDQQAMAAEFSPALRKSVVSSWAGVEISAASPCNGGR